MRPIATDAAWSVSVSASVDHNRELLLKRMNRSRRLPFGTWTRADPRNYVGPRSPRGGSNLGDISRPIVKYRKYPACGRYSQPYSVGCSSDAAFRCQYCSNLLELATRSCVVVMLRLTSWLAWTTKAVLSSNA